MLQPYSPLVRYVPILLITASPFAAAESNLDRARNSIASSRLQTHVEVLADDTFEGREAGTRGGHAAAGYLVQCLQQAGLRPAGEDGSYYQHFGNGFRNVLATIRGCDPPEDSSVILVCGHFDHVGFGSRQNSYGPLGRIHNGADDNASGVAALLEIARTLASQQAGLTRSLLFVFWDGEEQGLLGSKHWLEHPTLPVSQIGLVVNVDMIGRMRDRHIEVLGTRTGFRLRQLISRQNVGVDLQIDFDWELKANSDHYPFAERGTPALMFHTGLHDDYHRPSDDTHLLNIAGLEQITRLLVNVLWETCRPSPAIRFRANWQDESDSQRNQLEAEASRQPPRLGIQWDPADISAGLRVSSVTRDSPAAKAGLQPNDLIVALDGRKITDSQGFQRSILSHSSPVVLSVRSPSGSDVFPLTVALRGTPRRFGISWRNDEAEPGVAILTRVDVGSAAAAAGLRVADRLYEVSGNQWSSGEQLAQWLNRLSAPLPLLVERDGRLKMVVLEERITSTDSLSLKHNPR